MFIDVRYDRADGWVIDENAVLQIPELREVLLDKELGVNAIAFIARGCDPDSMLAPVFEDDYERLQEAAKQVYEKDLVKATAIMCNTRIVSAIEKYRLLCMTPSVKLKQQFQGGMKKLGEFIEVHGKNLTDETVDVFLKTLDKMPKLINDFSEMNAGKRADLEETKSRARGDKELSYRSKKFRGKKK